MKILYAIQGTGNGHISRARDIIPELQKYGNVDLLVSGTQADVKLPYEIKYQFKGMGFIFGKSGGVDVWNTYLKNKAGRVLKEIRSVPVTSYDLVVNDFEPISAWACYYDNHPCIALSHQSAVLSPYAPQPKQSDALGKFILENYAPSTAQYGFHFKPFGENIFSPVIRQEIRQLTPTNEGHYTVYLPAYDDERIIKRLKMFPEIEWQVFSKHNNKPFRWKNVSVLPVNNEAFIKSMASSEGVLCGAGFETPAEALFLKKKLMVVPMKTQYEQQCNAAALQHLGVPVLKNLKKKHLPKIGMWLSAPQALTLDFPDETAKIVEHVVSTHAYDMQKSNSPWQDIEFRLKHYLPSPNRETLSLAI